METKVASSSYYIYFAVFAVNLLTFSAGGCWSWASPMLPKLNSLDPEINPLPKPTTTFENSWIASTNSLGAIVGPLAAGIFSEKLGKRWALLILGAPIILSHILCAIAVNVHYFLVARFLIGIGVGTAFSVVPAYVADIAEDKNRGSLGSMLGVFNCSGILFMYLVGPYLSVRIFSIVNLIAPVIFYVLFGLFAPDSPYDLIKQGKIDQAKECLMKLRSGSADAVQKELEYIKETTNNSLKDSGGILRIFKRKPLRNGLILSNVIMFFQQFSGIAAVLAYAQNIFETTGISISPTYSAMLIGLTQLLANFASSQLVERVGRRMLLIISFIFSMLSLVALGAYFFIKSSGRDVDQLSWLPIASLLIYMVSFNLGLANIPWIILAELFPSDIKAVSSTITTFFSFSLSFVITMFFPIVAQALGMTAIFWTFAGLLGIGCVFCIILVPETKGKTIGEIQTILSGAIKQ